MIRASRIVILAGVAAAACGSAPRPAALVALDGSMKDPAHNARVQAASPELFKEAQAYYAKANQAYDDGDTKAIEFYTDLATVTMATADEHVRIADADAAVEASKGRVTAASAAKTEQDARLADLSGRVARMERIAQLQQQQQLSAADRAQLASELAKQKAATAQLTPLAEQKALLDDASAIPLATARQDSRGIVIALSDLFKAKKTQVLPTAHGTLKAVAELARKYPSYPITVDGYTDSRGNEAANLTLSAARAQSVAQFLVDTEKLEFTRIKSAGHGAENPIADNSKADGRAKNNRVEVVFVIQ